LRSKKLTWLVLFSMRLDRQKYPFDYNQYDRRASSAVTGYISGMAGASEAVKGIEAYTNDVWLEQIDIQVARTLVTKYSSTVTAGYFGGEQADRHTNSDREESRLVGEICRRHATSPESVAGLEATCKGGLFSRFLDNTVIARPAGRVVCHLQCGSCSGRGRHTCPRCSGSGKQICATCGGSCRVLDRVDERGTQHYRQCVCVIGRVTCSVCRGATEVNCEGCRTTGQVSRVTSFEVHIQEKRSCGELSDQVINALGGSELPLYETAKPQCELISTIGRQQGHGYHQYFTFHMPVAEVVAQVRDYEAPAYYLGLAGQVYQAGKMLDHVLQEPVRRMSRACSAAGSGAPWRLLAAKTALLAAGKTPAIRGAFAGIGKTLPDRMRPLTWLFLGIPGPRDGREIVSATNGTLSAELVQTTTNALRRYAAGTKVLSWLLVFVFCALSYLVKATAHTPGSAADELVAQMWSGWGWAVQALIALAGIPGVVRLWLLAPLGTLGKRL
jgi:hypothetical protein